MFLSWLIVLVLLLLHQFSSPSIIYLSFTMSSTPFVPDPFCLFAVVVTIRIYTACSIIDIHR
jgi:membrane protein YqaA with SNARE-associated domain